MLGGEAVSQVYDNGKTFDLTVKTSDESRATMEAGGGTLPRRAGRVFQPLRLVAAADGQAAVDAPRGARPVSYTHLDVYKRQVSTLSMPHTAAISFM